MLADVIHSHISKLRARIAEIGLTQERVALEMGIDRALLSRYLNGLRTLPPEFEKKVNAALDLLERAEKAGQKARDRVLNEEPKSA